MLPTKIRSYRPGARYNYGVRRHFKRLTKCRDNKTLMDQIIEFG
jgi:hypothetical protein